jgi:Fic family protein
MKPSQIVTALLGADDWVQQILGEASGHTPRRPRACGLTQREVALLLGLSERGVRAIERRALRKLAQHPQLREIWRQFLAGELTEQACRLSAPEIEALWGLARSRAERETLRKVLAIVQR